MPSVECRCVPRQFELVSARLNQLKKRVIIIGGGLAGLACAVRLNESGIEVQIVERADAIGGRVRTDEVDGFLLDRGFQVFLSAYPQASQLLDCRALDLRPFKPGALVFKDGKFRRMMDVFRCPGYAISTALQPIGTLRDKLLVGKLRLHAANNSLQAIASHPDTTTESYLRTFGFSEPMIDQFFRAFYGGIFLERELQTSSHMFEFTFKMFAEGSATLPGRGMQEIPNQLATRLPTGSIRLNTRVRSVVPGNVTLETGEQLSADYVVIATDAESASPLLPGLLQQKKRWRSTANLYFSADAAPSVLGEAIIALNSIGKTGQSKSLVNNVCVPSDVAPAYAPRGKSLVSVSVLGSPDPASLEQKVRLELREWFGYGVDQWHHLRTYYIPHSLPEQPPASGGVESKAFYQHDGILICGDHCTTASIEGAISSGLCAAEALV
ncbi:MAG: phytoene dehydrogenase-like protein [Verrucomicrobiales bacterium]|jgi:phytoene dehydrogenase-like protein